MTGNDRLITAEEFARLTEPDHCELVRGCLVVMETPSFKHGLAASNVAFALHSFVRPRRLGEVLLRCGYVVERNPDTVLGPDVSFVRAARLSPGTLRSWFEGPPDLAVEVLSPDDRVRAVDQKVDDYLRAGGDTVWLVDPETETVGVFRRGAAPLRLTRGEVVTCEELLPGFQLPLDEIFRAI